MYHGLYLNARVTFTSRDRRTSCKITVTSRWHRPRDYRRGGVATSSVLPVRSAAGFYRTYVIAFSSVMIQVTGGRKRESTSVNLFFSFSPVLAAPLPSIPRRRTPRVARVMWHVSDGRRRIMHVSHARCVAAASACDGYHRRRTSRHLAPARRGNGLLHFLFLRRWSRIVDAAVRHRTLKPHRYLSPVVTPRTRVAR